MKLPVVRCLAVSVIVLFAASASAQLQVAPRAPIHAPLAPVAPVAPIAPIAPAKPANVQVTRDQLKVFGTKLDAFRNGLGPQERRIIDGIVKRAASRPAEDPTRPLARSAAFDNNGADLGGTVHGALGLRNVIVRPGGNVALGPKQDDPGPPPPPDSKVSLGPKQDDPGPPPPPESVASFDTKLQGFSATLSVQEKSLIGLLFARAAAAGASAASGPNGCFPPVSAVGAPRTDLANIGLKIGGAGALSFGAPDGGPAAAPRPVNAPGGLPR